MRKVSLLLVLAIVMSMFAVPAVNAEQAAEWISYDEYSGQIWGGWDSIRFDDVIQGEDGLGAQYVKDRDYDIVGIADKLQIRGWLAFTDPVVSYGYIVDDKEIVLDEAFFVETEQPVYDAAASIGLDYAYRFYIEIDVSSWTGTHNIKYCAKLEDGTIVTLINNALIPLEFDFTRTTEGATPTPEPTKAPLNEGDDVPGVWIMFDNDYAIETLQDYIGSSNHILSIDLNEELKCAEIYVQGADDPNIYVPLTMLANDDISADEYKAIAFCYQFDPSEAFGEIGNDMAGGLYWQTEDHMGFGEDKKQSYKSQNTSDIQVTVVSMEKPKKWTGLAQDFRYDFLDTCNNDFTFNLYYIAFFKTAAGAEAFAQKYAEVGNEAFPATPVPTEVPTKAPTEAPTTAPEVTEAPATEAPKSDDAAKKDGGSNIGLIIGIVAAVVVAAAAAVIIIKKKKK